MKHLYAPTCGIPYCEDPEHKYRQWTYGSILLVDPKIMTKLETSSLFNNGKALVREIGISAGLAHDSGGCQIEKKFWFDSEDSPTPAGYRPYIIIGVQPYGFEPNEENDPKTTVSLDDFGGDVAAMLRHIEGMDRITEFNFSVDLKDGESSKHDEN